MGCAVIVLVGLLVAPEDSPAEAEMENIQGTWTLSKENLFFAGEEWSVQGCRIRAKRFTRFTYFELNPGKAPNEIDIFVMPQPDGQPLAIIHGIYSLNGDSLKLCLASFGKARPAGFPKNPKPGEVLIFQRQK